MVSVSELANFIVDPDECDPSLHQAAFNGDYELLLRLLQTDVFIENIDFRCRPFGATPLRLAATGGHPSCIRLLLDHGAQVDLPDYKAQTPLFVAIKNHYVECAKILLEAGANPNGLDTNRCTPLYIASQSGFLDGVRMLLDYGASTDTFDRLVAGIPGCPLQVAIIYQHLPCVVELLLNGAELNFQSAYPELPDDIIAQLSLAHIVIKFQLPIIYAHLLYIFGANLWQRDLKNRLCTELPFDCESKSYFKSIMGTPLSLTYICRNSIRRIVGRKRFHQLNKLFIPTKVLNFILCQDLYDIIQTF